MSRYGLGAADRYVFAREVTQEGMESCTEGEEEKINPHVLVRTRKRKVLSARAGRAEAGTIKCTERARRRAMLVCALLGQMQL